MKLLGFFAALVLMMAGGIGPLSTAAAQKEGEDKKELEKLQGKWEAVAVTIDGKTMKGDEIKVPYIEIKGEKASYLGKEKVPGTLSLKIDPSKSPAHLDFTYDDGAVKGTTLKGIYKIEGDAMTYCYSGPGKDRPTEFASKPGSGTILRVQKRAK